MLFDEPTTGLDPIIVHSIHELIASTHERFGFSGIVVSHEIPEVFSFVQKVAVLQDGVIRFAGTPEEAFQADDAVVREFIQGSLPAEAFGFRGQAVGRPGNVDLKGNAS